MLLDLDKKVLILIPSFKPTKILVEYINELIRNNYNDIVVINDGSPSEYDEIFDELKAKKECTLLKNETNMGKGVALKKGLEFFKEKNKNNKYIGVITVDSDGQHLVKDISKVAEKMQKSPKTLILGARNFNEKNVPNKSSFGNKMTSNVFKILYGKRISDTQTGFRGIPTDLIDDCINISGNRFEYETNMLIYCILNKIEIEEVPIETVYIDNNSGTSFRPIQDSISIYAKILNSFIKYSAVSVISCVIDIVLFQLILINLKLDLSETMLITISTVIARIVSSLVNYYLNKKVSFNSKKDIKNTILKYYMLCIIQMILSASLVSLIYYFTGITEVLIKIVVDTIIFFINYRIQRTIIFNK